MKKRFLYKSTFVALLLGCVLFAMPSHAAISVDAQVQCLTSLSWFEGINPGEAPLRQAVEKQASETFSFSQLQQAARRYYMSITCSNSRKWS